MIEQEEFFSSSHKRLLTIATWAKYLAWVALVAYILLAGLQILPRQSFYSDFPPRNTLLEQLRRVADAAVVLLRGVIYYLVLKGISLGLNMIVETDVNCREQKEHGGVQ
jgi:hypothetical protein